MVFDIILPPHITDYNPYYLFLQMFYKKNSHFSQKWFTLIELMIVITIVGILSLMATSFNFNKKTDQERRDRLVAKIGSMIRTNNIAMTSGKWVKVGANIINPTSTRLVFTTGSISTNYYSGVTIIGTWEVLTSPFFWESGYALDGFYKYTDTALTGTSAISAPVSVIFENNNITFTGANSVSSSVVVGMTAWYHGSNKILELDRRFWKITIR